MPKRRASKVNPALKKFMKGKKTGGKRTSPYTAKPKAKTKKTYKGAGGMARKVAGKIRKRSKSY